MGNVTLGKKTLPIGIWIILGLLVLSLLSSLMALITSKIMLLAGYQFLTGLLWIYHLWILIMILINLASIYGLYTKKTWGYWLVTIFAFLSVIGDILVIIGGGFIGLSFVIGILILIYMLQDEVQHIYGVSEFGW